MLLRTCCLFHAYSSNLGQVKRSGTKSQTTQKPCSAGQNKTKKKKKRGHTHVAGYKVFMVSKSWLFLIYNVASISDQGQNSKKFKIFYLSVVSHTQNIQSVAS